MCIVLAIPTVNLVFVLSLPLWAKGCIKQLKIFHFQNIDDVKF